MRKQTEFDRFDDRGFDLSSILLPCSGSLEPLLLWHERRKVAGRGLSPTGRRLEKRTT